MIYIEAGELVGVSCLHKRRLVCVVCSYMMHVIFSRFSLLLPRRVLCKGNVLCSAGVVTHQLTSYPIEPQYASRSLCRTSRSVLIGRSSLRNPFMFHVPKKNLHRGAILGRYLGPKIALAIFPVEIQSSLDKATAKCDTEKLSLIVLALQYMKVKRPSRRSVPAISVTFSDLSLLEALFHEG